MLRGWKFLSSFFRLDTVSNTVSGHAYTTLPCCWFWVSICVCVCVCKFSLVFIFVLSLVICNNFIHSSGYLPTKKKYDFPQFKPLLWWSEYKIITNKSTLSHITTPTKYTFFLSQSLCPCLFSGFWLYDRCYTCLQIFRFLGKWDASCIPNILRRSSRNIWVFSEISFVVESIAFVVYAKQYTDKTKTG